MAEQLQIKGTESELERKLAHLPRFGSNGKKFTDAQPVEIAEITVGGHRLPIYVYGIFYHDSAALIYSREIKEDNKPVNFKMSSIDELQEYRRLGEFKF